MSHYYSVLGERGIEETECGHPQKMCVARPYDINDAEQHNRNNENGYDRLKCVFTVQISISLNQLIDDIVVMACAIVSADNTLAQTNTRITQKHILCVFWGILLRYYIICSSH